MNIERLMTRPYIGKILLLVCFYCFNITIYAADNIHRWKNIGPEGANIGELVISPSDPNIVYSMTTNNNLFRSDNGGEQWEQVKSIEEVSLPRSESLLIDPINPDILFAKDGLSNALLRSKDGGKNWQSDFKDDATSFFSLNTPVSQPLRKVVFNDTRTEQKIATSLDGGENWVVSQQAINSVSGQDIHIVGIDPNNSDVIYGLIFESSSNGVLRKSIDGGNNWVNTEPSNSTGFDRLIIHPVNSDILFGQFRTENNGSQPSWFNSQNGGETWEVFGSITGDNEISQLIIDSKDSSFLYARVLPKFLGTTEYTDLIIGKSSDFGKSWELTHTDVLVDPTSVFQGKIAVNPDNNQHLFSISNSGIFKSVNGGVDWGASHSGLQRIGGTLSVAPSDQNTMYLFRGGFSMKPLKSIDGGKQWDLLTKRVEVGENGDCSSLIFNPKNSQEALCHATEGLYKSIDAGETWDLFQQQRDVFYEVYSEDGKTIYYLSGDSLLFKITETNGIWDDAKAHQAEWNIQGSFGTSILLDPRNSDIIYTVGLDYPSRSVYKSQNAGESWQKQIGAIHGNGQLLMHSYYPERLAFVDGTVVSLSDSGGNGWIQLPSLSVTIGSEISSPSLIFNPRHRDGLFLSSSAGIYESKDLGESWHLMDLELSQFESPTFQRVGDDVYATSSTGILKLTHAPYTEEAKECLFNWAEDQYPTVFSPSFANSERLGDYIYRYYSDTDTYLGFFQDKKVHLLERNKTNVVLDVGFVEYYQSLSGCDSIQ